MNENNKSRLLEITDDGDFIFEHNEEAVQKILDTRYSLSRSLLPFFSKKENELFYAGYSDRYRDAFEYLLSKFNIDRYTGALEKDVDMVSQLWEKYNSKEK